MEGGLGIGLMAASTMMGAVGESQQLKADAAADAENARRTLLAGALETADTRRRGRAVQGEAIASLAEGGGGIGAGTSAADLLFQNQLEIEYDVLSRRYGAASEAADLEQRAARKRAAARGALFGGMLRAGAQALTGIDQLNSANAASKAQERLLEARFPGAQRLPIPAHLQPTYRDPLRGPPRGY